MEYIFEQIQKGNDSQLETLLPWSIPYLKNESLEYKSIPHTEVLYWTVVFFNRRASADAYRSLESNNAYTYENSLKQCVIKVKVILVN